jgi:uncharacterized repeat protein (TIGR01451 family)
MWTRVAASVALILGTGGSAAFVLAQSGAPKYYPGTVTPYQPPTTPPVRASSPAAPPPTNNLNTPAGNTSPAGGLPLPSPTTGTAPPPKPKLFGSPNEGVRPVAATGGDLPKPISIDPPTTPGTGTVPIPTSGLSELPPIGGPSVTPERGPTLPPPVTTDRVKLPTAAEPLSAPTTPPATPTLVPGTSTGPKQAPAVTVEYEMPESIGVGQPLSYSLVVRNTGTSGVTGVRVEQELPSGATFVSSEPQAETTSDGRMGWAVGNLDAAAEKRIKVTVKPTDEGELRGRATVTFASAVEGKVKVTRPRIGVNLTASEVVRVGEKVVFTIKLTNTGSGPANAMTLHARLTDGLSHPAGHVIEAPLSNLPAGQTKTLTLEAVGAKPGAQQCTLSVFADSNPAETAKVNVTLVEPQLTAKQTGPTKCLVKAEPVYQIELTNPGTAATDPLTVWTLIPEGFEFVQASDGGAFATANKAVVWKLSGLTAGSNKTITVKLKAVGPTDGVVRTIAQSGTADQTSGVVQASAKGKALEAKAETVVKAEGVPALRFEVMDLDDPVEVGKEAVYEIKVTNQGTGACTNVTLVAELADGTTVGTASGPSNGRASGNSVVFEPLPQLPVKGDVTYKVRVKGGQPGDFRFRVKLTCDQIKSPVSKEENTRFYKE